MCEHMRFDADVEVARVTHEDGSIMTFMAHVQIRCAECRTRFGFVGLPSGFSFTEPMVSPVGNLELRAPITPEHHVTSMLGGDPATAFPVRSG